MAERGEDKPGRGLFGMGGRRPPLAPAARTSPIAPADASGSVREDDLLRLNLRALAGAAHLQASGQAAPASAPRLELGLLNSRPVRYRDMLSGWLGYWAQMTGDRVRPHRKLWEFCAVLQALYEAGALEEGARGLGFGCGDEPLPSVLAKLGLKVVATDLPGEADRDRLLKPGVVDAAAFDGQVEVSNLDIRRLDDATLKDFDFCWSAGLMQDLGGMGEASDAIIGAMDVLKPGGVAVHTADFAFAEDMAFSPVGGMSYSRGFFEKLAEQLEGRGHQVTALDFDLGDHPLDGYVDVEPFEVEGPEVWRELWREAPVPHLKVCRSGQVRTSFVFIVRARQSTT
jgi:hypothetical protein